VTAKTRKQQFEEMLLEDPGDSFLRYGLALEFVGEGNDAEALSHFQALLEADPNYVPGYHQSGLAFVRLGRVEEAGNVLRQGIDVARRQGDMHAAEEMGALLDSIS
jgi:Tfp pilus assembly protein PilF